MRWGNLGERSQHSDHRFGGLVPAGGRGHPSSFAATRTSHGRRLGGVGRFCAPLLALLLASVTVVSLAPAAGSPDPATFTIEADRITMRCTSNLLELLAGDIKAEDVVMENVRVSRGYTTSFPLGTCNSMEVRVTFLSVLGVAITNFSDLIRLLLGETVTLERVKMKAYWAAMDSLSYGSLEVAT